MPGLIWGCLLVFENKHTNKKHYFALNLMQVLAMCWILGWWLFSIFLKHVLLLMKSTSWILGLSTLWIAWTLQFPILSNISLHIFFSSPSAQIWLPLLLSLTNRYSFSRFITNRDNFLLNTLILDLNLSFSA